MKNIPKRAYTYEEKRKVMEKILSAWVATPDLRLGQFLFNACGKRDIFYVEDEDLADMCMDFLLR